MATLGVDRLVALSERDEEIEDYCLSQRAGAQAFAALAGKGQTCED